MYKFSNKEQSRVNNLSIGIFDIDPTSYQWAAYQKWVDVGGITEPFNTPQEVISEVRSNIIQEGRSRRYGGLLIQDKWVSSDQDARLEYLALRDIVRDMISSGSTLTAPVIVDGEQATVDTLDNISVPLTCQRVILLIESIRLLDMRLKRVTKYHLNQVTLSADPVNYDYLTGWPLRYEDTI